MPVELDRSRNVTNFIQQYIFIDLDQPDIGIIEMLGDPTCLYQHLWMGITGRATHTRGRCFCSRHLQCPPTPKIYRILCLTRLLKAECYPEVKLRLTNYNILN